MKTAVLFSVLTLLGGMAGAAPSKGYKRWYTPTSPECTTVTISSPDTDAALGQTPLSKLSNLGPYSPFLSQQSFTCRDVPEGFTVDQVQIFARHGARNPTASALTKLEATLAKLANATSSIDPTLEFVTKGYTYGNVTADALTDFGRRQMWIMGKRYSEQYWWLKDEMFVRASSDARVVESGQFFLQGAKGQEFSLTASKPSNDVIMYEGDTTLNDTLSIGSCLAYEDLDTAPGDVAEANWSSVFAKPIAARINKALGTNITSSSDVTNLMSLCSFDSLKGQDWVESPWCGAFTKDEFTQNEYWYDLSKFYDHAWGSNYGRVQGVGLVNEILARLTSTPVLLGSGTNSTLDTNNATFPLGKTFYAEFSHDNNLASLLPALGLSWESDLPSQPEVDDIPAHKFVVSNLVPFAGRYIFERLLEKSTGKHYVRVIVNDAVQRLDYAQCGDMGVTKGICEMNKFVEAQSFARQVPSEWDRICYSPAINKTVALQP